MRRTTPEAKKAVRRAYLDRPEYKAAKAKYDEEHRAGTRDARRASQLKHKFGLTPADYADLLQVQGGVCAVCGNPEKARRGGTLMALAIDHDHESGQIRALLCANCNLALGHAGDSSARLLQLAAYLESYGR